MPKPVKNPIRIPFCVDVTEASIKELLEDIFRQISGRKGVPVILYISSDGGDAPAGMYFLKMIKHLKIPFLTVAVHKVHSSALYLYLAGERRYSLPGATFLVHDTRLTLECNRMLIKDLRKVVSRMGFLVKSEEEFLAKMTGMKKADLQELSKKDKLMSAEEAKKLGLVHDIFEE